MGTKEATKIMIDIKPGLHQPHLVPTWGLLPFPVLLSFLLAFLLRFLITFFSCPSSYPFVLP
jgi:hypothetical protein